MAMQRKIRPMEERFWSKVDKAGPVPEGPHYAGLGPCWVYCGGQSINRERAHLGSGKVIAARYSWEMHHGPIPAGLLVRHRCDRGDLPCVNPDHLELGTQADNVADMRRRRVSPARVLDGRMRAAIRRLSSEFGVPNDLLAEAVGVHPATVKDALRSDPEEMPPGKYRPSLTDAEAEEAAALLRAGKTLRGVAKRFGRDWAVVKYAIRSRGLDTTPDATAPKPTTTRAYRRLLPGEVEAAIEQMRAGASLRAAALALGTNDNNLRRCLDRLREADPAIPRARHRSRP